MLPCSQTMIPTRLLLHLLPAAILAAANQVVCCVIPQPCIPGQTYVPTYIHAHWIMPVCGLEHSMACPLHTALCHVGIELLPLVRTSAGSKAHDIGLCTWCLALQCIQQVDCRAGC